MNRLDFLKEVAGSIFQTVKYVYEPFLKDDIEKVEEAADRALGITWVPVMKHDEMGNRPEVRYASGKPVIIFSHEEKLHAISGICPACSNLIQVRTYDHVATCMSCDKEYNLKTMDGELSVQSLQIKRKDQMYVVGLTDNGKR
ncbi:Rieske 2Fe-2S domain-containing protein [Ectobacillus polymachus]|uniref:Rieske 2Fe-2S domain-containing protein n=1 Tax=Ectobacillus polymachus TaxID=1508806 RepID=UPI003A86E791